LCGFTPPHFAVAGFATQALIRAGKTSVAWNVMRNTKKIFETIDKNIT